MEASDEPDSLMTGNDLGSGMGALLALLFGRIGVAGGPLMPAETDDEALNARVAPPARGRPRDLKTDQIILQAAREILAENGYEGMTFDAIAQRANVGKPTVYRRWPSKAHIANQIANGDGNTDYKIFLGEGGIGERLYVFLEQLIDWYNQPEIKSANIGLLMSFHNAPALRDALLTPFEHQSRNSFKNLISDAINNGDFKENIDPDVIFDMLVGSVIYRTIISSLDAQNGLAKDICEIILYGVKN